MEATLIHLEPSQKRRLVRRARRTRQSVAQEVRNAVDMYLGLSPEQEKELFELAAAANVAADRMIKDMDHTLAVVRKARKSWRR